jgi:hypothetical protein
MIFAALCAVTLVKSKSSEFMEKVKAGLNILIFMVLAGFIGLEVWNLVAHFLK